MKAVDFCNWLVPFFNPKPVRQSTKLQFRFSGAARLGQAPDDQPFGVDLGDC